jgi:dihydrolipoamide dehydrogenase
MAEKYDIAIIGAGPGGYVAAIRAAQLGFKTVCIDKRATLGGTCLNVGCIPSKALLQSTEWLYRFQHQGKEMGIESSAPMPNFSQMMTRKNQIVKGLVEGIAHLFAQHKVASVNGEAHFINPNQIETIHEDGTKEMIEAHNFILATGSESLALPDLPFDERQVLSSTGALSLKSIPKRLLVIGGGVIGVELASVYNRLGSKVTIIEMLDHLCTGLDKSLSSALLQSLKKQGIDIFLSTQMVTAVIQPNEVILTVNQNDKLQNLSGDAILVSVGRGPNTKTLQLDNAGVEVNKRGYVLVDGHFRTTQPHIFAIGDAIEGAMLAHRASAEGVALVEWLKGEQTRVDYLAVPNVIYTDPEVASVGLSEQEALQLHRDISIGKSFFKGNPRARCSGETEGFVKIIGDKPSGRLLGMHIIGPHASELIAEGMLAIQKRASVKDLANAPNAHPTLSETIKEAALDAIG